MLTNNNSEDLRRYINDQYSFLEKIYYSYNDQEKIKYYFMMLDNFEKDINAHFLTGEHIPKEFDFGVLKMVTMLTRIQLYTDYYKSVKYSDKLYNSNITNTLKKNKCYGDIKTFTRNPNVQFDLLDSTIDSYKSLEYDKVLLTKCLDKSDVDYLTKINPFFKQDYDKYNVEINLDFITKNIEEWQNYCSDDPEISYIQASEFIFDLYKVNKDEAEFLLLELFKQDLGIISSVKESEEESIKMGQVILNIDNLSTMFKDYYKYQKKVLNKRR